MSAERPLFVIDSVYTLTETDAKVLFPDETVDAYQNENAPEKALNLCTKIRSCHDGGKYQSNSVTLNTQQPDTNSEQTRSIVNGQRRITPLPGDNDGNVTAGLKDNAMESYVSTVGEAKIENSECTDKLEINPQTQGITSSNGVSPSYVATPFSKKRMILSRHYNGASMRSTPTSNNAGHIPKSPLHGPMLDGTLIPHNEINCTEGIIPNSDPMANAATDTILCSKLKVADRKKNVNTPRPNDYVVDREDNIQSAAARLRKMAETRARDSNNGNEYYRNAPWGHTTFAPWNPQLNNMDRTTSCESIANKHLVQTSSNYGINPSFQTTRNSQSNNTKNKFDQKVYKEMIPRSVNTQFANLPASVDIFRPQCEKDLIDSNTIWQNADMECKVTYSNVTMTSSKHLTVHNESSDNTLNVEHQPLISRNTEAAYGIYTEEVLSTPVAISQNVKSPLNFDCESTQANTMGRDIDNNIRGEFVQRVQQANNRNPTGNDVTENKEEVNLEGDRLCGTSKKTQSTARRSRRRRRHWTRKKRHNEYGTPKVRRNQNGLDELPRTALPPSYQQSKGHNSQILKLLLSNSLPDQQQVTSWSPEKQQFKEIKQEFVFQPSKNSIFNDYTPQKEIPVFPSHTPYGHPQLLHKDGHHHYPPLVDVGATFGEVVDNLATQYMLPNKAKCNDELTDPPLKECSVPYHPAQDETILEKTPTNINTQNPSNRTAKEDMTLVELLQLPSNLNFDLVKQMSPACKHSGRNSVINKVADNACHSGVANLLQGSESTEAHLKSTEYMVHGMPSHEIFPNSTAKAINGITTTQIQLHNASGPLHTVPPASNRDQSPKPPVSHPCCRKGKRINHSNGSPKNKSRVMLDQPNNKEEVVYERQAERIQLLNDILKEREFALQLVKRLKGYQE